MERPPDAARDAPTERAGFAAAPGTNEFVADLLDRVGDLLEAQHANPFRVRAYHHGAHVVRTLAEPVANLVARDGAASLEHLEGIGWRLGAAIAEIVRTGALRYLDHLEGEVSSEERLQTIPGLGPELAHRIREALHVDSLEALEVAAHDGRLEQVHGVGPRRAQGIREHLELRLGPRRHQVERRPEVAVLLAIDAEYRERADRGEFHLIAPRRFNPDGHAWLPVWHAEREGWSFTAMFSNTGRAHQLGTTRDWVVIFYEHADLHDQATVVTERRGELVGKRVVRGREDECRRCYHRPVDPDVVEWAHHVADTL